MNDPILCEKCGTLFKDPIVHAVTKCDSTSEARDSFWCDILNINPISFSIHLADLTDDTLVIRLLSCEPDFNLEPEECDIFRLICVKYIYRFGTSLRQ